MSETDIVRKIESILSDILSRKHGVKIILKFVRRSNDESDDTS